MFYFILSFAMLAHMVYSQCQLILPNEPLTATGLATPYTLLNCTMSIQDQQSFVQATIFDLDTCDFFVYNPLVVDFGKTYAGDIVVPQLPPNHIIGIWFGSNADTLTLTNQVGIANGNCINGLTNSVFGQFAYCNADAFFRTVDMFRNMLKIPPLGVANDGLPCPTTRNFIVVDADPSDNLPTTYLLLDGGKTAQNNEKNRYNFNGISTIAFNPSDEALVSVVGRALGCGEWSVLDLADPPQYVTSLALNEIRANYLERDIIALVAAGSPFTLVNNKVSIEKLNLYRRGVFQPVVNIEAEASLASFCFGMLNPGLRRLINNNNAFTLAPSPSPLEALNLYTFLIFRWSNSFDKLNCADRLGVQNPVKLIFDGNIVVDVVISSKPYQNTNTTNSSPKKKRRRGGD
jgi:hypothetical protein